MNILLGKEKTEFSSLALACHFCQNGINEDNGKLSYLASCLLAMQRGINW